MSDKVPLTAERKAEIYAKIEAGEYGTKETAEPGCKKIFDLDTSNPVGFICVKCGRIFSECSGGYRYQHIRMCNGTKESSLNIRKKKSLKPTPPRPIPILPVTLSNSVRDPSQSTSSNFSSVFISNGFNEEKSSGLHASTWINALSSRQEKEKFVADLSKLLLDHLPLRLAVESINAFEKSEVMGDYPEDFSHDQNSAILSINR
ncbi:hypothetical protein FO519_005130 [Halicephalobus sp. NKZ332]|nr:hypothetical protein FO519_005130 [Halicephalobus sp. NKZ332]